MSKAATKAIQVLFVDDDALNREVGRRSLAALGYEATGAPGAEAALAACRRESFGLIILDCHMPGIDGFQAHRMIRALERELGRAPAKIIAMTADGSPALAERIAETGFEASIAKPFRIDELKALLARLLG